MPNFAIIQDYAISGDVQVFYKLYMDGICLIDEFADSLSKQKRSALRNAYTTMSYLAKGFLPPGEKWHKLDSVYDLQEAKHNSGLRVYFYHNAQGQIIILGSFQKGKQSKDINEAERIIQLLPADIRIINTEKELDDYINECKTDIGDGQ